MENWFYFHQKRLKKPKNNSKCSIAQEILLKTAITFMIYQHFNVTQFFQIRVCTLTKNMFGLFVKKLFCH